MVPSQIALSVPRSSLGALVVDRLIGDPHSAFHPVALLGRFIGWWGRPVLFPRESSDLPVWCSGWSRGCFRPAVLSCGKGRPLVPVPAARRVPAEECCFAWRSLEEHTLAVMAALKDGVGNGREKVKMLVSRETAQL